MARLDPGGGRAAFKRTFAAVAIASMAVIGGLLAPTGAVAAGNDGKADDPQSAPIAPSVEKALDAKGSTDIYLVFKDKADLDAASKIKDWTARGDAVVKALQDTANASQAEARAELTKAKADFTPFWISNRILVRSSTAAQTNKLAALPGVERVAASQTADLIKPEPAAASAPTAVEWGIAAIKADQVWGTYGVRGEGITVANIDSGVQYTHPALVGKYRGNQGGGTFDHNYNWFDPSRVCGNPSLAPCDPDDHGSHTMGTMVGDDGGANQIGVAPGAKWVSAVGCDSPLGCSENALLTSGQWVLAPTDLQNQNPRTDLRPNIVNNSWGAPNGPEEDPWYDDIISGWTSSGIFGVFSNGNAGPGCDTAGSPADSALAYGVGGFQSNGAVYNNSSRGPGANGEIRPNISAPAVSVRSSIPDNSYANFTGTSMAAPHVAGTVALMWSAAPALVGDIATTRTLLNQTAIDTDDTTCGGTPTNNNVWGEGKLDALAAVTASPRGESGTLTGTVTNATTGAPISGAQVKITGASSRTLTTTATGTYTAKLSTGDYNLEVSAYAYGTATGTATVATDATVTKDFALTPVGSWPVLGEVSDSRGDPVAGAVVKVNGTPLAPATTDADGVYEFAQVPVGTYNISVTSPGGCSADASKDVVVNARKIVNFRLADRVDAYGYHCESAAPAYQQADTGLALTGDDAVQAVNLPFTAVLYGQAYTKANISTNGLVNFAAPATSFTNTAIPAPAAPNASVYAFWDDLVIDATAKVYTKAVGTAPNRSFIIEWRNALIRSTTSRVDFEIVINENSDIVVHYRNLDPNNSRERGDSATVGVENSAGNVAVQYSFNSGVLSDSKSVKFTLPPNGFVSGTITDANDGLPVTGAAVTLTPETGAAQTVSTGADGKYFAQLWNGVYKATVKAPNYTNAAANNLVVTSNKWIAKNFVLKTGRGEIDTEGLRWVLPQGNKQQTTFTLSNTGSAAMNWSTVELGGSKVTAVAAKQSKALAAKENPAARSAAGSVPSAEKSKAVPFAAGDVLDSWPTGLSVAWGVGKSTSNVWVSNPETVRNKEFAPDGTATGRDWPGGYGSAQWNADMAFDTRRNLMCQVAVLGDNAIHCWDPATGNEVYSLAGGASTTAQRGLAYKADDDTFYVGGWVQDVLFHVAGASHATPGAVLSQCPLASGIAGLAYNRASNTLWVTNSDEGNTITQHNPDTCAPISSLSLDEPEGFALAGADLDAAGNVWATSQNTQTAYLLDTGVPQETNVPWLTLAPAKGRVAAGGSVEVTAKVNTTGLAAGVYRAVVEIHTTSGRQPVIKVPVEVVVSGYWKGVNSAGAAGVDTGGIPWVADKAYTAGTFGWIGASTTAEAPAGTDIRGTEDDALYVNQRIGMDAYQFDKLPGGRYEVTLDFAELELSPRVDWRAFDVEVNGQYVLVNYDIADAVGGQRADRKSFVVDVPANGNLKVGFHDRRGYEPSVVNAIRVVHRPDL
ncbi:S8 family serine peptidase [Tenggerimyces flavus]|uniref:S8 family serine peptidase n=1 Tax=Tenggerimyces flavus TaxID=1708749 RepID=A0ABV7Y453_9ACTN|nr:carboxypeptidase regulatory-like domain-containing protein [Tenggerimyces flavus]MBM7790921.1 subtilisin family serine protease [Tenggerimyces flavus]